MAATWKVPPSSYLGLTGGLAFCLDEAAAELLHIWREQAKEKQTGDNKEFTL